MVRRESIKKPPHIPVSVLFAQSLKIPHGLKRLTEYIKARDIIINDLYDSSMPFIWFSGQNGLQNKDMLSRLQL